MQRKPIISHRLRRSLDKARRCLRRWILSCLALVRCGQPAQPAPSTPAAETSAVQETLRGAAIGVGACLVLVWLAGGSSLSVVVAVIWGSSFGALIGLLLWVGSVVPEDPIVPPAPGQARDGKADKPRRRP